VNHGLTRPRSLFQRPARARYETQVHPSELIDAEVAQPSFDPALSVTRLDADLLEAALLAAASSDLDVRVATAALLVLETGMACSELSRLSENQLRIGEGDIRWIDRDGGSSCQLSPALGEFASMLVERNRAIERFSGWLAGHESWLFQSRETVRNRQLKSAWFRKAFRGYSRDMYKSGMTKRQLALSTFGLLAHHRSRRNGCNYKGYAA